MEDDEITNGYEPDPYWDVVGPIYDQIEDLLYAVRMGYEVPSTEEILERLKKELEA